MKPCRPPPHRGDPSPIDVLLAPDFQLPETPIFHCLPQVQSTTTPIYTQMKHGEAGGWPKGRNDPPPTGAEDVYKIWRSPCERWCTTLASLQSRQSHLLVFWPRLRKAFFEGAGSSV